MEEKKDGKKRKQKEKKKTKRRKSKRRIRSAQCSYLNPRGTYLEGTVATTEVGDEVGPGMLQDAQSVFLGACSDVRETPGGL